MAKTIVKPHHNPHYWHSGVWNTKAEWQKWERVGMRKNLLLEDIVMDWRDQHALDLDVTGAIESVQFDRTVEGASTFAITVRDPHNHLFSQVLGRSRPRIWDSKKAIPVDQGWQEIEATDIIERAVDIHVDGVYFRLVKVNVNWGISQYVLTFEDRIINRLRHKKGSLSASRAQVTRAEFILRMLREVKVEKVPFICPELHKKQIIAKGKDVGARAIPTGNDVHDDPDGKGGGFSKGQRFTIQGGKATDEQKRNMATVIDEASSAPGATPKAIKAVVEAVIVESWCKNLAGGDADSRGILQVRDSTAGPRGLNNRSIRDCVHEFMTVGFWGKGSAISIAKANPKKSAGWVAQQTQGSAHPERYDKWSSEADHWLEGVKGKGSAGVPGGGGSYVKSYQYKRDKNEDSWTAMRRLADEVNWRLFTVGRVMYFMSEDDLYRRRVRHVITPNDDDFIDFQGDVDWGKPVNEITMQVTAGRWDAPPGCVIDIQDFPAISGRWLVASSTRDWFSPIIELTLKQPGNPDKEPAHDTVQRAETARAGGGGGVSVEDKSKSAKFWHYANLVSKNTPGYSHAGHGVPLSGLNSGVAFDCSSSTSWVCYKAGMWEDNHPIARVSAGYGNGFDDWGLPGHGERITIWCNKGHVFSIFEEGMGVGHKRFDTGGPGGGSGARVRDSWRSTSGFEARHWPGT